MQSFFKKKKNKFIAVGSPQIRIKDSADILKCLGIKSGDEVITTTFTFPATSHVIEHVVAKPFF